MVLIPKGKFSMGCVPGDTACDPGEKPQHDDTVDAFLLDVHEVTVARYQGCVDAGKCAPPGSSAAYATWGASGTSQHPINHVTWIQADTFCTWTGGRLPTEAEWERAARGGLDGKTYPWGGEAPTCTPGQKNTAVFDAGNGAGCGKGGTWPVGTGSGANGLGLFDTAGNVWEWVADWNGPYPSTPVVNPLGPSGPGQLRIMRGGYFGSFAPAVRTSARYPELPAYSGFGIGFRCARNAP
jgi:formylglycine-generating enzyme required for sulfatase activity